jgi:hypothetical protein
MPLAQLQEIYRQREDLYYPYRTIRGLFGYQETFKHVLDEEHLVTLVRGREGVTLLDYMGYGTPLVTDLVMDRALKGELLVPKSDFHCISLSREHPSPLETAVHTPVIGDVTDEKTTHLIDDAKENAGIEYFDFVIWAPEGGSNGIYKGAAEYQRTLRYLWQETSPQGGTLLVDMPHPKRFFDETPLIETWMEKMTHLPQGVASFRFSLSVKMLLFLQRDGEFALPPLIPSH